MDAVYADPPYTKRQYAAYYHILETIAAGDRPLISGDDWTPTLGTPIVRILFPASRSFRFGGFGLELTRPTFLSQL